MTHAPLNRSRFPRHNGRLHANTFRRLRLALALSLTVLLTITPFNFSVRAQQSDGLSSDPETALEVKGDKILKMVHRAAAVDRASGVKGRSTTMSREARAADDDSAIDRLSRVAGIDRKSDGTVSVDLTVELTKNSDAELKAAGFAVGARIGHIATVETDVERLPELAALPSVRKMKGATYSYTTNDLARQAIKIDNASGQRVVPYTGRGVVVGIIDGGIDFRHLDFTVPGSNGQQTRIKALLDMTVYGSQTPDPGWNYSLPGSTARIGHLYTEDDINKALKVPKPANQDEDTVKERDKSGHGTHVAGIAAGNGLAGPSGNTYAGMAPEADLVIVKANRQNTSDANFFRTNDIINALKFIQQQATEMGKPFVINISLGGHIGPHDGSESHEVAVDELVSGGPLGRAVCIAAGNEGDNDIHASGYVPAGGEIELKLEAKDGTSVVSPSFFELYYPSADRFSLTITRPDGTVLGPYAYIGTNSDPFYNNPDPNIGTIFHGDDAGQHNITVVFKDSAKSLGSSWSFKLRGEEIKANGHFDVWAGYGDFQAPYVDGSRRVATPGTSRGAITVGAFVSRRGSQMPNEYAVFTSPGPTADGRPKPDISAPGRYIYSSKSSDAPNVGGGNPAPPNGSTFHIGFSGTSMASPMVTGSVALLLQANPNLTSQQIKRFITNYADNDSQTTPDPSRAYLYNLAPGWDSRFGFGKLNVAAALGAVTRGANAINDSGVFVRQQYVDFLFREPDTNGYNAWVGVLGRCPNVENDPSCDRIEVSASFFRSDEFQIKGYYVYRFYKVSLGRVPQYTEIIPDMRSVTGSTPQERDAKKVAFTNAWVTRPEFTNLYPESMSAAAYVDKLLQTEGVTLTGPVTRDSLISDLQSGRRTRATVLQAIVESVDVDRKEYNGAFVAMQYFGYLRRDPEPEGYNAWLRVINRGDSYRVMVDGFANSDEYKQRFGY